MSGNENVQPYQTPSKQRSRKRSFHDSESEDSFDSPVEFIPMTAKKTKFGDSPAKTPSKQPGFSKSPLKRSPKIVLGSLGNTPQDNHVVSDWDDSPDNSLSGTTTESSIDDQEATPFATKRPQEFDKIQGSFENIISKNDSLRSIETNEYYLDTLLQTISQPKQYVGSDSLPAFFKKQVLLRVVKFEKPETEAFHIFCKNSAGEDVLVYLQGPWEEMLLNPGMEIRLIDPGLWDNKDYIISPEQGYIIVEPDVLLTSTAVSGATWCPRKVILNHRYKGCESANKAMLIGCIMHELFQIAVKHPEPPMITKEWLFEQWRRNISLSVIIAFVSLKFSPRAFETELIPYAEVIVNWVRTHMTKGLAKENMPTGTTVLDVHDIEENIWDPILGMKGKIDTTLKVKTSQNEEYLEALELKTGKSGNSTEHSCQVLLYSLMLSIRYNQPMHPGSLLYLKDGTSRAVIPKKAELVGILQQRNILAYYLSQKNHTALPEPRQNPHFCGKCEQALTCSLYVTNGRSNCDVTTEFKSFSEKLTAHLDARCREYFDKWSDGIFNEHMCEKNSTGQKLSDLWKVHPEDRETKGEAVAGMILKSIEKLNDGSVQLKLEREKYFEANILQVGSVCTISHKDKFGIALCPILEASNFHIVIRCERKFYFLKEGYTYDLDAYNNFSSFASSMGNLVLLMGSNEISMRLRSLIIEMKQPEFASESCKLPTEVNRIISSSRLTKGQRDAVERSIMAQNYSLIEGLPGAGKTTTITVLIRCLVAMGKTILLTSYTNSAVDTVISKLLKDVPSHRILRLGRTSLNPQISGLSLEAKLKTEEDVQKTDFSTKLYNEARTILQETPIVACTCYHSSRELLLSWRTFDVCIIDEASMVLEPIVLPALAASSKFIMVGDAKQLAPLVLHKPSKANGLNVSLFERLQVHKNAVVSLTEQFRMNRMVANLANQLFYEGRLVCANSDVAESTIDFLCRLDSEEPITSSCIKFSCIWIDIPAKIPTSQAIKHTSNEEEAEIIRKIVADFEKLGVPKDKIGIMCTYTAQVEALRNIHGVEVNTIDQFQGRDKNIIIWSLVWTSFSKKKCELLHDERRVNVALTRAKQKLIIVGCQKSMQQIPIMAKIIPLVQTVTTY